MAKIGFALVGVFLTASASAGAGTGTPDIDGVWMRDDGNARVRIAPCGSDICATNLWIRDTSGGENVGDKLIMTLNPRPDQSLAGTAYDPKRRLSYAITVRRKQDELSTQGCVLGGLLCKTVTWARVGP